MNFPSTNTDDETLNAGGEGSGASEATPSLREQLTTALAAASSDDGGAAAGGQQDPAPAPQAQAAPAAQQQANTQPRTADGQFAQKPATGQNALSQPAAQQAKAEPPQQAAIVPPASWSATAKASFAALPPHIQQEVAKREADIEKGLAQQQTKSERLNRLDAILGPRQQRFQLAGIDEVGAINTLFAAWDMLDNDPVNALLFLARQRGVGPQHLAQAMGMQQGQQQPPMPPAIQQMQGQVQALINAQAQQQANSQRQAQADVQGQLEAFAADPANPYFHNVRELMGHLMASGQATTLADAYQKAIWAHPETRTILLQQQQQGGQQAARAKAEQARHASGSVTGSPSPGAAPAQAGQNLSLRQQLEEAFRAQA